MNNVYSQISIASYSFHKLLEEGVIDIFGYLESLRFRYNIQNADIWNGFIKDMNDEEIIKVRRAMDDRGLVLANLCCDWAHPWSDNKEELEEQNRMAEKMLRFAEILGAKTVRIDLGVREDDISEAQFDYTAGKFSEYAKIGVNAGFVVGPENHWGASRRLAVQQRLYKEINSPGYGMLLHLGNWNLLEGETADGNDRAAISMAVHTHVSYDIALRAEEALPPLKEAGYKGAWGVEHHLEVNEYHGVSAHLGRVMYALSKMGV